MQSRIIYHITSKDEFFKACRQGYYAIESLKTEGFIHFSQFHQFVPVANRRYVGRQDLLLLCIDPARLDYQIVEENTEGGEELFPHLYGPLNLDAILRVVRFPCSTDGFSIPDGLKSREPGKFIALLDIDSTLLKGSGAHKLAFELASREVLGKPLGLNDIKVHGQTDPILVQRMLELGGIHPEEDLVKHLLNRITFHYYRMRCYETVECLPGVFQLLHGLKAIGGELGIVTGNLEPVGWGKLQSAGISSYFRFGVFSSDSPDRNEMVRIILSRSMPIYQKREEVPVFLIGDAVTDMQAARQNGVTALGVNTGIVNEAGLSDAGAHYTADNILSFLSVIRNQTQN